MATSLWHFYSTQSSPSAWVCSQSSVSFVEKKNDLPQLRLMPLCVLSHWHTSPHFIFVLFDSSPTEDKDIMKRRSQQFQIRLQLSTLIYRRNESLTPSFTSWTSACLNDVETSVWGKSDFMQCKSLHLEISSDTGNTSYLRVRSLLFLSWAHKNCSFLSLWGLRKLSKCAVL